MNIHATASGVKKHITEPKQKIDWALETAAMDLPVFPVHWPLEDGTCSCGNAKCLSPGKHPLPGAHLGFKNATTDPDQLRRIWADNPQANPAAYPGKDYVIIDLDKKWLDNGTFICGLTNICEKLGLDAWTLLTSTYTVQTPRGGYHLYFLADQPYSSDVGIIPGVDVRALGGYVVAAGAVIGDATYTVVNDAPMVMVPPEINSLLLTPRERDARADEPPEGGWDGNGYAVEYKSRLRVRAPAIEGEGGNRWTYKVACEGRDLGLSHPHTYKLMRDHWNDRCQPPWDEDDLWVIVGNAYKFAKGQPGARNSHRLDRVVALDDNPANVPDDVPDTSDDNLITDDPTERGDRIAKFRAACLYGCEDIDRDLDYEMIAENWIPAVGFTVFLGHFDSGKTTVMMDLCCRLACDMRWNDLVELETGWAICWVSAEDDIGVTVRKRVWTMKHGVRPAADRWLTIEMPVEFTDLRDVNAFAKFIKREARAKLGGRRVVFVVDTLQRMTEGAESQSNDRDMSKAMKRLEKLVALFDGPAFIACHPPKSDSKKNPTTVMGSSVIPNKSQAIIQCTDLGKGKRQMRVHRIKGGERGSVTQFELEKLSYTDQKGKQRKCVAPNVIRAEGGIEATEREDQENALIRQAHGDWIITTELGGKPGAIKLSDTAKRMSLQSHQIPNGPEITFKGYDILRRDVEGGLPNFFEVPYWSAAHNLYLCLRTDKGTRKLQAMTAETYAAEATP